MQYSLSNPSDRHEELEDPSAQNIPSAISHLEQCVTRVQSQLEHLNNVVVPRTEILTDFALPRSADLDTERNRIRSADLLHARQLSESYLMRLRESDRRNAQQRQRLDALETRTTMAESVCTEQMTLNKELAEVSIRTLRQFADVERRRAGAVKAANNRCDSLNGELDRCKSQRGQQEQTIGLLRESANSLNQEMSSLAHQLNRVESEKNGLRLERDKFKGETDSLQALLVEQENTIAVMREREKTAALELNQRDALVDSLVKERADLEKEMLRTRKEFESLLARQERETDKQLGVWTGRGLQHFARRRQKQRMCFFDFRFSFLCSSSDTKNAPFADIRGLL
uniref:Uncharacterized protein n=1 Tax=Globodera pallida TaxID=36090 RepID=A0A183CM79_GLOPA